MMELLKSSCGIAAAFFMLSTFAPSFAQAPGPQASIVAPARAFDASNYDVEGLGELDFDASDPAVTALGKDLAAISGWAEVRGAGAMPPTVVLKLEIAKSGIVTGCSFDPRAPASVKAMCPLLRANAHFNFNPHIAVPFDTGFLNVSVAARKVAVIAKPIQFVPNGQGAQFSVGIFPKTGCGAVGDGRLEDEGAICAAWQAAGMPGAQRKDGMIVGHITVAADAMHPVAYDVSVGEVARGTGPVQLAPLDAAPGDILTRADGWLQAELDYPPIAARYEIQGRVSVWLGFDRQGNPQTCVPVYSSNGAYLANSSCDQLLRISRFHGSPAAAKFDGVRYYKVPIVWVTR